MDITHQDDVNKNIFPDAEGWEIIHNNIKNKEDSSSIASDWSFVDDHLEEEDLNEDNLPPLPESPTNTETPELPLPTDISSSLAEDVSITMPSSVVSVDQAGDTTPSAPVVACPSQRNSLVMHSRNKSLHSTDLASPYGKSRASMARMNARLAKPKIVKQLHRGAMMSNAVQRSTRGKMSK